MDVVLEVSDQFMFDYMYAWLLPARPALYDFPDKTNGTAQAFSSWVYEPATEFFSLEPSQAAYQSIWARDNIYRQALSLFLILWCAKTLFPSHPSGRKHANFLLSTGSSVS